MTLDHKVFFIFLVKAVVCLMTNAKDIFANLSALQRLIFFGRTWGNSVNLFALIYFSPCFTILLLLFSFYRTKWSLAENKSSIEFEYNGTLNILLRRVHSPSESSVKYYILTFILKWIWFSIDLLVHAAFPPSFQECGSSGIFCRINEKHFRFVCVNKWVR